MIKMFKESIIDANQLFEEIKNIYYKYFRDSFINGGFSSNIGSSITIRIALGKDKSEFSNGIIQNDPIFSVFFIYGMDKEGILSENLESEKHTGAGVSIPSTNPLYAYESIKVPYRKTKGNSDKILKSFDIYFSRLYDIVKEYKDVINVPFDSKRKL